MNQSFIQINDNTAVVIDENKKIIIIKKDNDEYTFEEILKKENELEQMKYELSELEGIYKERKALAQIGNVVGAGALIGYINIACTEQEPAIIGLMPIGLAGASFVIYSTSQFIKNKKRIKVLIGEDKEKMKQTLEILENMKQKTKYIEEESDDNNLSFDSEKVKIYKLTD